MGKLTDFFIENTTNNYLERIKTKFFIWQNFAGIILAIVISCYDFLYPHRNIILSFVPKAIGILIFVCSLFILKWKNLKIAGNFFSLSLVITILISINIIKPEVSILFKFFQGFYSIFGVMVLGVLFSSQWVVVLNTVLILVTTSRVYLYALNNKPDFSEFFNLGFISHTTSLIFMVIILLLYHEFSRRAVKKYKQEAELKEAKNRELLASEEEVRASYEELQTTSDALNENIIELAIAKSKAEESDKLKSEFLNNLSHEIRTPLNGIVGFANLLNNDKISDKEKEHFSEVILKSSENLLKIIEDILEISKLKAKQIEIYTEKVNLNDFLSSVFFGYQLNNKKPDLNFKLKRSLPNEKCNGLLDRKKLLRILQILLDNAVKYTHKGSIELAYKLSGSVLEIAVKDTGIGIKPENREKIFHRFWQEEKEISHLTGGLGLGLTLALENAKLLGGNIKVESEKNKGSVFTLTMPYSCSESTIKTINTPVLPENKTLKILIAEDEDLIFLYFQTLFRSKIKLKAETYRAINGKEAIEIYKKNSDLSLIFMDLRMPVLDGFNAIKEIRALNAEIPIIAQSAYNDQADIEKAKVAGCSEFISKPISIETINRVLSKYL